MTRAEAEDNLIKKCKNLRCQYLVQAREEEYVCQYCGGCIHYNQTIKERQTLDNAIQDEKFEQYKEKAKAEYLESIRPKVDETFKVHLDDKQEIEEALERIKVLEEKLTMAMRIFELPF